MSMNVHEPSIMSTVLELSKSQLLETVNQMVVKRQVSRPTLARWRKQWGFDDPPYTIEHAQLFAIYGDFLSSGFTLEQAHSLTIKHLEERL
jgi:hypothetical protein